MKPLVVLGIAAFVGVGAGAWPALHLVGPTKVETPPTHGEPIAGCGVTDGDTIRCGSERIRLLGIDAPELAGHCRPGRSCAPGDPIASKDRLAAALTGDLRIVRVSKDRYERTLATVSGARGDLSCAQLAGRAAIYRSDWDDGKRVAQQCPEFAR